MVWTCMALAGCGDAPTGPTAGAARAPSTGEEVYNRFCFSCHAAGIAGAPRTGVAEAWAPRLAKGRAVLLESTIRGMPPGMPAMGLCAQCSNEELQAAIDHMLPNESGG